jgi:GntR family transcriptional regulator
MQAHPGDDLTPPPPPVILLYHYTRYRRYTMSKTVPLFISVSPADPRSITRQIADGIRMAIASGEVPVGAQLPSVRGLAQQLTINPKTVAKAYSELVSEGWLHSSQGLGLFVAAPSQRLSETERERRLALAVEAFSAEVIGLDYPVEHILARISATLTPLLNRRSA